MRARAGAAVGVIAELVDVETALGVGIVALEVVGDGGGAGLGGLLEGHGAADLGVTTEDGDCRVSLAKLQMYGNGHGRENPTQPRSGRRKLMKKRACARRDDQHQHCNACCSGEVR